MDGYDSEGVDYEVTEEGVFYEQQYADEGQESDPLASDAEVDQQPHVDDMAKKDASEEIFGASVDDIFAESRRGRRRKRRRSTGYCSGKKRTKTSDVPQHLAPVMGNARLAYMARNIDEAETALRRVITEAPKCADPYRMLALIYEEKGEKTKALETYMEAAEIAGNDRELWKRNAIAWEELGNKEKAIFCYSRALRGIQGKDADALKARGMLYMEMKKYRMAGDSFIKLSRLIQDDVSLAKLIVHSYKQVRELHRTITPLEAMIRYCEHNTPRRSDTNAVAQHESTLAEFVQILVETRFELNAYYEASMFLGRIQNQCSTTRKSMPFVQRLMVAICQHRMGSGMLASPTFLEFLASPSATSKHGFLLWEVADACRDGGDYVKAVRAYTLLLKVGDGREIAKVYLRRAICHKELGNRRDAKEDLRNVLRIVPRHVEASMRIVEFLEKGESVLGRRTRHKSSAYTYVDDLGVLRPRTAADERKDALHFLFVANTLYDNRNYAGFLAKLYPALETAFHLGGSSDSQPKTDEDNGNPDDEPGAGEENDIESMSSDEEGPASLSQRQETYSGTDAGAEILSRISGTSLSATERARLHSMGATILRTLDSDQFVDVADRLLTAFKAEGSLASSHSVVRVFESLTHLRTKNRMELRTRLKMLYITAALAAGDAPGGYEQARQLALDYPDDPDIWYAFSLADQYLSGISMQTRIRTSRFISRLMRRVPRALYMLLVGGNNVAMRGLNSSSYALGLYLRAYKERPTSALICLCVGVQMLYVAMSRRVENRNETVALALGFFNQYKKNRVEATNKLHKSWRELEANYNTARALHQLGLVHMAADLYKRVLNAKGKGIDSIPMWADVRRDAAYNLAQIYRRSGSPTLAANIITRYLAF